MSNVLILLNMLSSPRSLMNIGGLALIVMVYMLGPMLGLRGSLRLIVVCALLFLFLVLQLVVFLRNRRRKDKAAADLETSMIMEADDSIALAEAGQKRAREDARRELVAAIDVLKKSSLSEGRGGKAALYVLPWYLILGRGFSGKSSMVANSGLQNPGKGPGELRGIGASANCEWWFTNHAVLLEADRRFTAAAGAKAAESDWDTYLTSLSKQRPSISLNGVVLTVSAADLMHGSVGELEDQARLLRKRLDAMANRLKLVFPVYLMVTKMDLVQGFNEYFSGLAGAGADQILGATVRASQMRAANPETAVAAEFELLYENLCRRRQMRLVQDDHVKQRDGTYLFPLQFRSLGNNLNRFVKVLCEPNAYGRNPLLRGFYFSSAGGEGEVCDQVLHETNRVLGLPAPAATTSASGQPLFLRGFFRKVLVPDRDIARPTRGAARRSLLMRRIAQVAALAVMAGLVVNLAVAFVRGHHLISETENRVGRAMDAALAEEQERVPYVDGQLQKLDLLQAQLVELDRAEHGIKRVLWMGLNRARRVNESAREVYLDRFTKIVSRPYVRELEQWLLEHSRDDGDYPQYYRRYQAYRMLFKPTSGDSTLVADVLTNILTEEAEDDRLTPASKDRLRRHLAFAMSHPDDLERIGTNNLKWTPRVEQVAGDKIALHFTASDYYERIVNGINERRTDLRFSLDSVPQAHTILALRSSGSTPAAGVVPASFTRRGWDEEVSEELGNIDAMLKRDAWLLPSDVMDTKSQLKIELLNLYADDYIQNWRNFLGALVLKSPGSMESARKQLVHLQSEELPYLQLIKMADDNLTLEVGGGVKDEDVERIVTRITGSFAALHAYRKDKKLGDDTSPQEEFVASLLALGSLLTDLGQGNKDEQSAAEFSRDLFATDDAESSVIGKHMELVHRVCFGSEFGGDQRSNDAFNSVLRLPALYAWQAVLNDTERYLDQLWAEVVYRDFVDKLQNKYPFASATADGAGLADFGNFFGNQGTLPLFLEQNILPYLNRRSFKPKMLYDNGLRMKEGASEMFRKGDQLRQAFFPAGASAPGIKFNLIPRQSLVTGRDGLYVTQTTIRVGDQTISYDTGSMKPEAVVWPTDQPSASITAVLRRAVAGDRSDSNLPIVKESGDWGLFRIMALADQENPSNTRSLRTWKKSLDDGPGEVVVQCELVFDGTQHAFTPGILGFRCLPKLHD